MKLVISRIGLSNWIYLFISPTAALAGAVAWQRFVRGTTEDLSMYAMSVWVFGFLAMVALRFIWIATFIFGSRRLRKRFNATLDEFAEAILVHLLAIDHPDYQTWDKERFHHWLRTCRGPSATHL